MAMKIKTDQLNDEVVIGLLKELDSKGVKITQMWLKNNEYGNIIKYTFKKMGGLNKAKELAGIKLDRKQWTKELTIKELQELYSKGEDVSYSNLRKINITLYHACVRYFGSYKEAVEFAGIDYEEIIRITIWTKELIIKELQRLHSEGEDLSAHHLKVTHSKLSSACFSHFESYEEAITEAGLDYSDIIKYKQWTTEQVIEELQRLHSEGEDLSARKLMIAHAKLFSACYSVFETYEEAITNAGLDYSSINRYSQRNNWTKELIIEELQKLLSQGEDLSLGNVKVTNFALYHACKDHFGSYKNAITEMGLDYSDIIMDDRISAYRGKQLESIISRLLTSLSITHESQKRFHLGEDEYIIPDFQLTNIPPQLYDVLGVKENDTVWIDSKLSRWTYYHCGTEEKYTPHCDKLIFLYLRGMKPVERVNDKVNNMCVIDLLHLIPNEEERSSITEELHSLSLDLEASSEEAVS